jgi:hypothetical protein
MKNSFEFEYVPTKKLAQLLGIVQEELINRYELDYERLVVKESMFMASNSRPADDGRYVKPLENLDENEILIDVIIRYREAF